MICVRVTTILLAIFCWGNRLRGRITPFLRRTALADGGHAAGGIGTLGVFAVPILTLRAVEATAPAFRKRPVHAAVVVIAAGSPLHETFKSPMIAIGKIHDIPPSGLD